MADTREQTDQGQQQGQVGGGQSSQQQFYGQPSPAGFDQAGFDAMFSQHPQIGGSSSVQEAWSAYWELADNTLRTARRISEYHVLSLMRQELTRQITGEVIAQITRNPQLLKPVVEAVAK